jgi:plastocyanin
MERHMTGFIGGIALVVLAGALITSGAARPGTGSEDAREIQLVVRDMTFYLAGDETPNPLLRVRAGERIRILLRNEDAGITHDFAIEDWQVATKLLEGRGEDGITFSVPPTPGRQAYTCTPHAQMMRGTILVE